MRQLNVALLANESFDIYETGEYIRILEALGGAVLVESSAPTIFAELMAGQSVRVERPFFSLRITNGATPQTVVVIVGTGEFSDNTFSGAVTVSGAVSAVTSITNSVNVKSNTKGSGECVNTVPGRVLMVCQSLLTTASYQAIGDGFYSSNAKIWAPNDFLFSPNNGVTFVIIPANTILDVSGFDVQLYVKTSAIATTVCFMYTSGYN